jgi:hypothetical protein
MFLSRSLRFLGSALSGIEVLESKEMRGLRLYRK